MRTYTIKRGDTLSTIAEEQLGNAFLWRELYQLNREVILKAQREPARITMQGPDWIFPGTVLKLPETRA